MPIRDLIEPDVKWILHRLVEDGHEAYVVGGAVRDLLLDIVPKDYDISTSASPEAIRKVFGRRHARIIGRRFRLVHLNVNGMRYEISTFRRQPSDEERRARENDDGVMIWRDNEYGTLEDDAFRRDFTVNSLYYDVVGEAGIIDLVGGGDDLRNGVVRMIGDCDVRLKEDPVRLLRALKLQGQYGFRIEESLGNAIREHGAWIVRSSATRLFEELLKIMDKPHSAEMLGACREYGLLEHMWPSLDAMWDEPSGKFMQQLLQARDRKVAAGSYTRAKTLAVATLCFAPCAAALRDGDWDGVEELWEHEAGLERHCRDSLTHFMQPFPVPKYLSARARDVLLTMTRFKSGKNRRRLMRHPEYKYARELFLLLVEAWGWDPELAARWPEPVEEAPHPEHHYPRGKHVRRSHRKRWGGK